MKLFYSVLFTNENKNELPQVSRIVIKKYHNQSSCELFFIIHLGAHLAQSSNYILSSIVLTFFKTILQMHYTWKVVEKGLKIKWIKWCRERLAG